MSPVKKCGVCDREFDAIQWSRLPFVGEMADDAEVLELRNCPCGTTISIVLEPKKCECCYPISGRRHA